jgi:hypothetical protein
VPAANVVPYQIIAGVCDIYVAPFGTAFPAVDADPVPAPWRYLGHTDGGITVRHTQTVVELRTDQVTAPVKGVRSEENLEIGFAVAELSAENYAMVLNQNEAGPTDNGDNKEVNLYRGGFGVETMAMLVRGEHLSPEGDFNLQYEVPSVYQAEAPEVAFTKDEKALLNCNFMAIAANAFIEGTDDADIFGVLRVGTA